MGQCSQVQSDPVEEGPEGPVPTPQEAVKSPGGGREEWTCPLPQRPRPLWRVGGELRGPRGEDPTPPPGEGCHLSQSAEVGVGVGKYGKLSSSSFLTYTAS